MPRNAWQVFRAEWNSLNWVKHTCTHQMIRRFWMNWVVYPPCPQEDMSIRTPRWELASVPLDEAGAVGGILHSQRSWQMCCRSAAYQNGRYYCKVKDEDFIHPLPFVAPTTWPLLVSNVNRYSRHLSQSFSHSSYVTLNSFSCTSMSLIITCARTSKVLWGMCRSRPMLFSLSVTARRVLEGNFVRCAKKQNCYRYGSYITTNLSKSTTKSDKEGP